MRHAWRTPRCQVPFRRLAIGESGVLMMTDIRGSSNENAKRAFAWTPMHANWREGFRGLAHATGFGRKELQHGS